MRTFILMVVLVVSVPSIAAGQGVTYLTELRFVREDADIGPDSYTDTIYADGFDPFDAATAFSDQQSSLNFNSLVGVGTVRGASGPPVGTGYFQGTSHFEATFFLSEAADYTLDLTLSNNEFGYVQFLGPSLNIDEPVNFNFGDPYTISESGILESGEYSVIVDIQNGAPAEGITGAFNLNFQIAAVPEPGTATPCLLLLLGFLTRRRRVDPTE